MRTHAVRREQKDLGCLRLTWSKNEIQSRFWREIWKSVSPCGVQRHSRSAEGRERSRGRKGNEDINRSLFPQNHGVSWRVPNKARRLMPEEGQVQLPRATPASLFSA